MSEAEKKRRLEYKKNRRKWIIIQLVAIAVVAVLIMASSITYYQLDKTYYIDYYENGSVDYQVNLNENDFYEESWQEDDQAYVAVLIRDIWADFKYELKMDAEDVDYEYSYQIDAILEIVDNNYKTPIYSPTYSLKDKQVYSHSSNEPLKIDETVYIDFAKYNSTAKAFVESYGLRSVTSSLVVKMSIDVIGSCDEFQSDAQNAYVMDLRIPLNETTVAMKTTASVSDTENKILACDSGINQNIFKVLAICAAVLEVLLVGFLIGYAYYTRNEDINYQIKIRRLVSSYKSFIQQINNEFDTSGYQILYVKTFTEMLGIRDTIQSPILMSENEDKTRTQFIIPTSAKLLYIHEIKVEDYDAIYGISETEATEE